MSWASTINPAPLPGIGARGARERQSVWCCGRNYQRWRFIGREFPGTHHRECVHCGQLLIWPPANDLPAKPRIHPRSANERQRANRRAAANRYRRLAGKFLRQGLTTRGQPRQRRASVSPLELAYQDFRETINVQIPELLSGLERHA